jgi:hypothetical protein
MISQATSAKKYDRALALLSRTPSKEWFPGGFPYSGATQLMIDLPPERDQDKQEIFRLAMAADREQHVLVIGGDDFASMIVRFWQHIPPAIVMDAIDQVLDAAQSAEEGLTLNGVRGNVGFTSERDYRVFELLPVLRQLDNGNIALKAWWPSVSAYGRLVIAASQFSPQTALERVREIKDPEILLLLEVMLASKGLGVRADQSTTMVQKESSHISWSEFRRVEE